MLFSRRFNWRAVFALLIPLIAAPGLTATGRAAPSEAYNPLAAPSNFVALKLELTIQDPVRQRAIPIRIYLDPAIGSAPVVLFSHGLGGSRQNNAFLGEHWAAHGYVSVFLQHPGSDEAVWRGKPPREILMAMKQAASADNFRLRAQDVRVVLDQLERYNQEKGQVLYGRLDMTKVGMSGHSFGAVTTQAMSGQSFPGFGVGLTDARIKAACLFSPSSPVKGGAKAAANAFGAVKIPWLLMTGTKDTSPREGIDLNSRLAVFPALPPGKKYEVVLEGAEHSAFGDRVFAARGVLPVGGVARNPNHHRVILALTTAFWDATLRDDAAARAWLDGDGPKSVLEKNDTWRKK